MESFVAGAQLSGELGVDACVGRENDVEVIQFRGTEIEFEIIDVFNERVVCSNIDIVMGRDPFLLRKFPDSEEEREKTRCEACESVEFRWFPVFGAVIVCDVLD